MEGKTILSPTFHVRLAEKIVKNVDRSFVYTEKENHNVEQHFIPKLTCITVAFYKNVRLRLLLCSIREQRYQCILNTPIALSLALGGIY